MMLALGRAYRFPGSPAAKSNDPMEQACPLHSVDTGDWMYCCLTFVGLLVEVVQKGPVRRYGSDEHYKNDKMKGEIIRDLIGLEAPRFPFSNTPTQPS